MSCYSFTCFLLVGGPLWYHNLPRDTHNLVFGASVYRRNSGTVLRCRSDWEKRVSDFCCFGFDGWFTSLGALDIPNPREDRCDVWIPRNKPFIKKEMCMGVKKTPILTRYLNRVLSWKFKDTTPMPPRPLQEILSLIKGSQTTVVPQLGLIGALLQGGALGGYPWMTWYIFSGKTKPFLLLQRTSFNRKDDNNSSNNNKQGMMNWYEWSPG